MAISISLSITKKTSTWAPTFVNPISAQNLFYVLALKAFSAKNSFSATELLALKNFLVNFARAQNIWQDERGGSTSDSMIGRVSNRNDNEILKQIFCR